MKRFKEITFDIVVISIIVLVIGWVLQSIRADQEDYLERCMAKGNSYTYCMRKMRP